MSKAADTHLLCVECRERLGITTPKVQYGDYWRCSDCAYRLERQRERDRPRAPSGASK